MMRIYKPEKVVELGTEAGYSAYHIARGLKENNKGHLYCYDLWESYDAKDYGFHIIPKSATEENLKKFSDIISLEQSDAINVSKEYESVDILHVDLHNEGEILDRVIPDWIDKVKQLIIIEGGSAERDKVEWMIKYKKQPIANWLNDFSQRSGVKYITIEPFPSVTIMNKKSK